MHNTNGFALSMKALRVHMQKVIAPDQSPKI